MELIHYTNNDDTASIGKKTDVNLRRMAARVNDRYGVLLSEIEDLKKKIKAIEKKITEIEEKITTLEESINTINENIETLEERISALEEQRAVPINGAVLASLSEPFRPEDYYDDMYWENIGSIEITKEGGGISTMPVWKRIVPTT